MKTYTYDSIVVGTGAAGYNASCRLKQFGKQVAIVTEALRCGTSRNTGSDKQTYYKLGLGGNSPDSVYQMAQDLFDGGCVDGDNALCEAALSARCFMHLCELGVEFPTNRYGEYVGYKTDHDPYARATSAGPLTSKYMTEALEKHANDLGVEVFSGYLAIEILKKDEQVCGILCLEKASGELVAFRSGDVILATGGPAGIYADSAYPECHTGSTSLALLAGAKAQNLTEWQYGLASVSPRWNVSGTYMQVLPRFVSIDTEGNEYEFLLDHFEDEYEALSMIFLKGYQWPFDSKKVPGGSSVIDLLVYRECVQKNRKVYLDFTRNPFGLSEIEYQKLSKEGYDYLKKAEACFGKPIERLRKMNAPAIELYQSKGRDITKEYLEIALCAQHNNGGIAVDMWWQTSVRGLFAVGECAGTHGITRPGGSALNAGQVGSLRAAQFISCHGNEQLNRREFEEIALRAAKGHQIEDIHSTTTIRDVTVLIKQAQRRMSDNAAAIRSKDKLEKTLKETKEAFAELVESGPMVDKSKRHLYYKLKDILVTQVAVLSAMIDYADRSGETRSQVQEINLTQAGFESSWRAVRPIPQKADFFETIWHDYRKNKNIF